MSNTEYNGLLKIASEQVPFGVYAVCRGDYAELLNLKCKSITELKGHIRAFRQKGFKVHYNGR